MYGRIKPGFTLTIATILVSLTFLANAEEKKGRKPIKETVTATKIQPLVDSEKENEQEEKEPEAKRNLIGILEAKKNILEAMKGQDIITIQKVMLAIDKAAVKGEAIAEKVKTKTKQYGGSVKEFTNNMLGYTKKQFELITNEDELYMFEEALDEMKFIYSDKLNVAREEMIEVLDKFEETFADKIDSAMESADIVLEKIEDKETVLDEHFSDIINEMNDLAYSVQDKFSDKIMDLTEEIETELDSALDKYEDEINKLIEKKQEEIDKKSEEAEEKENN